MNERLSCIRRVAMTNNHAAIGIVHINKGGERPLLESTEDWVGILASITRDDAPGNRIARLDCVKRRYGESGQSATFDV